MALMEKNGLIIYFYSRSWNSSLQVSRPHRFPSDCRRRQEERLQRQEVSHTAGESPGKALALDRLDSEPENERDRQKSQQMAREPNGHLREIRAQLSSSSSDK